MAVTMVIGNNPQISASLYAPHTMAVLANEFAEATNDLYLHALVEIEERHHDADHQRHFANVHLVDGPAGHDRGGRWPTHRLERGMTRNHWRRAFPTSLSCSAAQLSSR